MANARAARTAAAAALALAAAACVPYPGEPRPEEPPFFRGTSEGGFPGLDPGHQSAQGLHVEVRAYGAEAARGGVDLAERAYARIMNDTGLYSFRPRELYRIVLYGTADEYHKKTGLPGWSAGAAVGSSLYAYLSPRLEATLSHEMTHLVWHEHMGGRLLPEHRWVNEGLAVYQEAKAEGAAGGRDLFADLRPGLRAQPLSLESLRLLAPAGERAYEASLWYAQAESLTRFLIERGGRVGFGQFLAGLRDGESLDRAVARGFPGRWSSLAEADAEWRRGL